MKTFIKTFREDSRPRVESSANVYAANNNLEIINVSYTVRPFEGHVNDSHYLAVVFRKEEK